MSEDSTLYDLLETSFPGIKNNIIRRREVGFPWESKAFVKKDQGELVAHAGFFDYPMLVDNRTIKIGAVHAVCTKPTHRHQGLASGLIQEVLNYASQQYAGLILFTDIPGFYERFGFKKIDEYRFRLHYIHQANTNSNSQLMVPKDNALFINSFKKRAPSSNLLWPQDYGRVASFNTLFMTYPRYWSLYYADVINGIISYEVKDRTLHLYDIIAETIPSLDELIHAIPEAFEQIYFYFSPDCFSNEAIAESWVQDNCFLMAYGNCLPNKPFMISPLSRC